MSMLKLDKDDGTADWAAEAAVMYAAQAYYRRTHYEKEDATELMMSLVHEIRQHIVGSVHEEK